MLFISMDQHCLEFDALKLFAYEQNKMNCLVCGNWMQWLLLSLLLSLNCVAIRIQVNSTQSRWFWRRVQFRSGPYYPWNMLKLSLALFSPFSLASQCVGVGVYLATIYYLSSIQLFSVSQNKFNSLRKLTHFSCKTFTTFQHSTLAT